MNAYEQFFKFNVQVQNDRYLVPCQLGGLNMKFGY